MVHIAGDVVQVGLHVIHQQAQASVQFLTVMVGQGRDADPHYLGNVLMVHAKANGMQHTLATLLRRDMLTRAFLPCAFVRQQCADRRNGITLVDTVNVGGLTVLYNKIFGFSRHRYAH